MEQELPRCKTCLHFVKGGVEARLNTAGKIAGAPDVATVEAGLCHGNPPSVHIVPMQTLKGDALAPAPFRPPVLADDVGCRFHSELIDGDGDLH